MANTIEARVKQKKDTLANWMANPMILLSGEQAFIVNSSGMVTNYRMGDGTRRFSELPDIIQYDQAAFVPVSGLALPTPTQPVGYSILGEGTYTYSGGGFTVPAGHWGVANWDGSAWSFSDMGELPSNPADGVLEPSETKAISGNEAYEKGVDKTQLEPIVFNQSETSNAYSPNKINISKAEMGSISGGVLVDDNNYMRLKIDGLGSSTRYIFKQHDSLFKPSSRKVMAFYKKNGVFISSISITSSLQGFTTPKETSYAYFIVASIADGDVFSDVPNFKIMLNKGYVALPYQDYSSIIVSDLLGVLFVPKLRTLSSLEELNNLTSSSKLIPGERIICTLWGKTCLLQAISTSSVSRKFDFIFGENYDYYELDFQSTPKRILAFDHLACVVRNISGTWSFIKDVGHEPRRVAGISQTSDSLTINYLKTYTKVLTLSATPDESYSRAGIMFGASVALSNATILASSSAGFAVGVSGATGTLVMSFKGQFDNATSVSMQPNGEIRVFHSQINNGYAFIESLKGHRAEILSRSSTSVIFRLRDHLNNIITDPTQADFDLFRNGTFGINNDKLGISNSNIWVQGLMMTEFIEQV